MRHFWSFRMSSGHRILVVDLDRALAGDLRAEAAWAALSRNWRTFPALLGAGASLDDAMTALDVDRLPFRETVLGRLADWRAGGGRTVLIARDAELGKRVAAHLDLFDEVLGPVPRSGRSQLLDERFGRGEYLYQSADDGATGGMRAALRAMRPHQWAKNLLVFLPVLAAHQLDVFTLALSLAAFVAFSLTASSVYVMNDLLDLAADRAHPRKRLRPFAAGSLPLAWGRWLAAGLLATGLLAGLLAGPVFLGVLTLYYVVTLAYSLTLKRRLVIDICTLAVLYTLRIAAGGAATSIQLSLWLLAFSTFFFFALAAVKRQGELVDQLSAGKTSVSGRGYMTGDLPIIAGMALSSGYVAILVMALYINAASDSGLYATPEILWGICLVLFYWISRMVMITHRGWMHDDPVVFAFRDGNSRLCFLLVAGCAAAAALIST
jgi:4-hydroxybenzoate polyprenyltransferase